MDRILRADLDQAVSRLEAATKNTQSYSWAEVGRAEYREYRLVRERGADHGGWPISPGLPTKRALLLWIEAYHIGIEDGQRILKYYQHWQREAANWQREAR